MRSLLALLFAVVAVAAQNPPPPPDRIWFRQDSLSGGETCADKYAAIKGTSAENKGKAPIILPSDANFKICIKFESGSYTNPQTGEVVERAGRDWAHDSGKKSPCAEGCCEFQFGSLAKQYVEWFPTSSDCSNTGAAKKAPLYFKSTAGASAQVCAKFAKSADSAPEWQLLKGSAAGCIGPCCTIKAN